MAEAVSLHTKRPYTRSSDRICARETAGEDNIYVRSATTGVHAVYTCHDALR